MSDSRDAGDKTLDKTSDSKAGDSSAARTEAAAGMKDLADEAKSYNQARKDGARDRITQQLFKVQPEFYDSSKAQVADAKPDGAAQSGDKGQIGDTIPAAHGTVLRDAHDKPAAVTYPDGTTKTFDYGPSGELTKFGDKDGYWKKDGDGWNRYDNKDKATGSSLEKGSECGVDKKGDFIFKDSHGNKSITAPDGSVVNKDSHDKVTSVTKADGDTKKFEYGPQGELTKFSDKDGSWKNEGGTWNRYDKSDHKTGSSLEKGSSCEVDKKGDFIFKEKNGTKTTEAPDGSVVINDPSGKVSQVTDADGHTKKYEYGPAGELTKFGDKGGSTWKKDGDTWNLYDKDNMKTGSSLDKGSECSMDKEGNFTFKHPNGDKEITHPDATVTYDPAPKKPAPISL